MKHYLLSIIINVTYKVKKRRLSMTAAPQFTVPSGVIYDY